ncbi:MAG TPA: aldehyde dehydrogenase family protein, partial [Lacunisphaera sp.]|nr:aldehyde dehydrogenase family protein [Lacunisphaera sp.]
PEPIPVYAEMGSINPLFILPGAIAERQAALVEGLYASSMVGVGQFCTNPGVIVLQKSPAARQFVKDLAARLAATREGVMLTPGIRKNFVTNTTARTHQPGVKVLAQGNAVSMCSAAPVWFETDALDFQSNHALAEEIFGPSSLVVWCTDRAEMLAVAQDLEGNLTATLHAGAAEAKEQGELVAILAAKAGRVILNGYPTGLEVSPAIVHGGPYPATSDGGRSTSVGTRALNRWARLVCYQGFSDDLLPPELQNANPLGLLRLVNGQWTRESIR